MASRSLRTFSPILALICLFLAGHAPGEHQEGGLTGTVLVVASEDAKGSLAVAQQVALEVGGFVSDAVFEAGTVADRAQLVAGLHTQEFAAAVLTEREALELVRGEQLAEPAPLRLLAFLADGLVLVGDRTLGTEQAYMLLFALYDPSRDGLLSSDYRQITQVLQRAARFPVPLHVGARRFLIRTAESQKPD